VGLDIRQFRLQQGENLVTEEFNGVDIGPMVEVADKEQICGFPECLRVLDLLVNVRDDVDRDFRHEGLYGTAIIGCDDPHPIGLSVDGDLPLLVFKDLGLQTIVLLQLGFPSLPQEVNIYAVDDDGRAGGMFANQRHIILCQVPEAQNRRFVRALAENVLEVHEGGDDQGACMLLGCGVACVGLDPEIPEDRPVALRVIGVPGDERHVVTQLHEGLEDVEKPQGPGGAVEHRKQGVADEDVLLLPQRRQAATLLQDMAEVRLGNSRLRQSRQRRIFR